MVYGGEAMGRLPDKRAVFVPFLLPGEEAEVKLVESKRGFARAELLKVLEPASNRVNPLCAHFGICGGCHYQHMPYESQMEVKREILVEQLERIGGLADPPAEAIIPSFQQYLYRNHVQFHLTRHGEIGYLKPRSDEVLAIHECHLPEEQLNSIWPLLDFESIPAVERVGLRSGSGQDIQMTIESGDLIAPEMLVEELPISVVHLSPGGALVLAGSQEIWIDLLERPLRVSAGSFFQINTKTAESLVKHILNTLPDFIEFDNKSTILDLYCGVGLFSAFLAPIVGRLVGIESSPSAADDFVINLDEFDTVELYQAKVEQVLPQLELQPDIVLLDPPRSGVSPKAMDGLLKLRAPILVYISCDPATLSRDAKRLTSGGYRLKQITPFDMFPQTYHIESVSFWSISR
jgi:23S rRNA (uracil1939-C5)-methyltransferase